MFASNTTEKCKRVYRVWKKVEKRWTLKKEEKNHRWTKRLAELLIGKFLVKLYGIGRNIHFFGYFIIIEAIQDK